jgi:peptidoglycan/LPS O-acetylase OafA/YrhL
MQSQQNLYSTLIPLVIIGIVLFFRFRAMGKMRPLKLERLWIVPAIYLVITALMLVQKAPQGLGWLWAALSLAAGAALGWQRGRAMRITVDPETHALNQVSSPLALMLIVVLIAIRSLLRGAASYEGIDPLLITDCLVLFALGLLSMTRLEMYLRGSRLLDKARATRR